MIWKEKKGENLNLNENEMEKCGCKEGTNENKISSLGPKELAWIIVKFWEHWCNRLLFQFLNGV